MEENKKTRIPLILSIIIFVVEYLFIIGYYWIFQGRFGDASLTISRYVGLETWSSLIFCFCNLAITVLMICHFLLYSTRRGFVWKLLMSVFTVAFLALSISPHVPDESMPATIHRFFAGVMFVAMALIGLYAGAVSQRRSFSYYCALFIFFSTYFIVSDLMRPDYFMNAIFWFESAYLFAFFGILAGLERVE